MRLLVLLPIFALFALPAHAAPPNPTAAVEYCLVSAGDDFEARRRCIGSYSRACINSTPANQTTGGMSDCAADERLAWQALSARYEETLRGRESATQVALLDAYLRQHALWSVTRCAYTASYFEGGSLARYLAASCARDSAAELTLELYARVFDEGI